MKINFDVECPHCGARNKEEVLSNNIDGETVLFCRSCHRAFEISWELHLEATVYKIDKDPSDVDCSFTLEEDEEDIE